MKLWAGRSEEETAALADRFNASIAFDSRMYRQDITGSMAHAAMLAAKGILGGVKVGEHTLMLAVTEKRTKEEIDLLVKIAKEDTL